jgi:DNA-binding winged helix-turn-helix (wHTH) protein
MSLQPTDGFLIDVADETVVVRGQRVRLAPKAFQILRCLVDAGGRLVTKDSLMDAVWPDTHVTESALSVTIAQLRDALGDDARAPDFIQTVHRRGFCWLGPVRPATSRAAEVPTIRERLDADAAPASVGLTRFTATIDCTVVGREEAMGRLLALFQSAVGGQRKVAFVTGEAGIGKTTLVDALCATVADPSVLIARGQCADTYGEGEPYMPVLEAFDAMCRADPTVVGRLREAAPSWLLQIPGLVDAAEWTELARSLAGSTRERMIREFTRAVETIAAGRVVVLVLEDLHWSDRSTLALLAAVARGRTSVRLMLVATLRPVDAIARRNPVSPLRRELVSERMVSEIALGALSACDIESYLGARFAGNRFPAGLAEALLESTAGNPLFVVTAIDALVERGHLARADGTWTCTTTPSQLAEEVPDGVRAAIELQVERAGDDERALLEAAAIVGLRFPVQSVAAIAGGDPADIEARCQALARCTSLIREAGTEAWPDGTAAAAFAFRHALHRQVILARVGAARRRASHLGVAERLESAYGTRSDEIAGVLAVHFELGGNASRAIAHLVDAAGVAVRRLAHEEALDHLRRGLALLDQVGTGKERDGHELALRSAMISPSYVTAGAASEEMERHARRVAELTAQDGPRVETFMALGAMFGVTASRARLRDAETVARSAFEAAERVEWGHLHALAARGQIGLCLSLAGRFAEACPHLDAAATLPDLVPIAPIELSIAHASDAAVARWLGGEASAAREALADTAARAEASRHPPTMAYVLANRLRFGLMTASRDVVREVTGSIRRVAEISAVERWRGLAMIGEGWLASFADADGHAIVAEGIELLEAFGSRVYSPFYACARIEALLRHDLRAEAGAVVTAALARVSETGERWCEAELWRLAAACGVAPAGMGSDSRRTEATLRRAVALAEEQGAAWWRLRSAVDLAKLPVASPASGEVSTLLREAGAPFPAESGLPEVLAASSLSSRMD